MQNALAGLPHDVQEAVQGQLPALGDQGQGQGLPQRRRQPRQETQKLR